MQELVPHPSTRVTLDRYTQAVTPAKRLKRHPADSRITLERDGETAPFAITCGLAGHQNNSRRRAGKVG